MRKPPLMVFHHGQSVSAESVSQLRTIMLKRMTPTTKVRNALLSIRCMPRFDSKRTPSASTRAGSEDLTISISFEATAFVCDNKEAIFKSVEWRILFLLATFSLLPSTLALACTLSLMLPRTLPRTLFLKAFLRLFLALIFKLTFCPLLFMISSSVLSWFGKASLLFRSISSKSSSSSHRE